MCWLKAWFNDEIYEAHLPFGHVCSTPVHELAHGVAQFLLGIALGEELHEKELTPFQAYVKRLRRVGDVCQVEQPVAQCVLFFLILGVELVREYLGLENAELSKVVSHVRGQNGIYHNLSKFFVLGPWKVF